MTPSVALVSLPRPLARRLADGLRLAGVVVAEVATLEEAAVVRPTLAVYDADRTNVAEAQALLASEVQLAGIGSPPGAFTAPAPAGLQIVPPTVDADALVKLLGAKPSRAGRLLLSERTIDLAQGVVVWPGRGPVALTPTEVAVLAVLSEADGEAVDRPTLLRRAWGASPAVVTRAVDNTIGRLRAKIELHPARPDHLRTVRGVGYRLIATRQQSAARPIVGRQREMEALHRALRTSAPEIYVTGPAGVGKTTVSRAAVPLADAWISGPDGQLPDTGVVVIDGPWLTRVRGTALRRLIRVGRSVPEAGGTVVRIGPLATDAAIALLRVRLGVHVSPRWTPARLAAAAALSGGVPLFIEMIAELAPMLPPHAVLDRLNTDLVGTLFSPGREPRHADLEALLGEDIGGLDPEARALLAVLRQPHAEDDLDPVHLDALRARSLVEEIRDIGARNWVFALPPMAALAAGQPAQPR